MVNISCSLGNYTSTYGIVGNKIWKLPVFSELLGVKFSSKFSYCPAKCWDMYTLNIIPYSTKFWWGKFWRFWHFPSGLSKFNPSNYLKIIQCLQVYGERQWRFIKIFSVKYLKSYNIHQNFALYGISLSKFVCCPSNIYIAILVKFIFRTGFTSSWIPI